MRGVQGKINNLGRSVQSLGRSLTFYATGPLAMAGAASYKVFTEFSDTLQRMVGLAGVSQKAIGGIRKELLAMARDTAKGPRELAEGLYFINSAGVHGAKAMTLLHESAKAAASGLGEVNVVADALTSALNAYKQQGLGAKEATDQLSAAVKFGKGEADAFAPALGVVVAVASQAKIEFSEVAAGMAVMTRLGFSAARSATSLRSIIATVQDPSDKVKDGLKAIGLTALEARDMYAKDFFGALMEIRRRLDAEGLVPTKVFNSLRALPGFLAITGDSAKENAKVFEGVANSQGQNAHAFAAATKSAGFRVRQMTASIEAAAIMIGNKLRPALEPVINVVADFAEALMNADKQTKFLAIRIAAVVAAIGPGLWLFGAWLRGVAVLFTPIGALAAAVLGLGTAFGFLMTKSERFRDTMADFGRTIFNKLKKVFDEVREAGERLWDQLITAARDVLPDIRKFLRDLVETGKTVVSFFEGFFRTFIEIGKGVLPPVLNTIRGIMNAIKSVVQAIGPGTVGKIAAFAAVWLTLNRALRAVMTSMRMMPATAAQSAAATAAATATGAFTPTPLSPRPLTPGPPGSSLGGTTYGPAPLGMQYYPTGLARYQGKFVGAAAARANIATARLAMMAPSVNPMSGRGIAGQIQAPRLGIGGRALAAGGGIASAGGAALRGLGSAIGGLINPTNLLITGITLWAGAQQEAAAWQAKLTEGTQKMANALKSGKLDIDEAQDRTKEFFRTAFEESGRFDLADLNPFRRSEFTDQVKEYVKRLRVIRDIRDKIQAAEAKATESMNKILRIGVGPRDFQQTSGFGRIAGGTGAFGWMPGGGMEGRGWANQELTAVRELLLQKRFDETRNSIAGLINQYILLNGSLHGLNTEALRVYISAGNVEGAMALLEHSVRGVRTEVEKSIGKILRFKNIQKEWLDDLMKAPEITEQQRKSLALLLRTVEQSNVRFSDHRKQIVMAYIANGKYYKAVGLIRKTLADSKGVIKKNSEEYKNLQKIIDKLPRNLRFKVEADLDDAVNDIDGFFEGWSKRDIRVYVRAQNARQRSRATTGGGETGFHTGGWVGGGRMADIPAVLQEGEFVMKRSAAQKFGPLLERLNKYHEGGWVRGGTSTASMTFDTFSIEKAISKGVQDATATLASMARQSGGPLGRGIVRIGENLEKQGYTIGGHSHWNNGNPITSGHVADSWHYKDMALDINWPGGNEKGKLDALYSKLKNKKGVFELLWQVADHYDHLHFAYRGGQGGGNIRAIEDLVTGRRGNGINVFAMVDGLNRFANEGAEFVPGGAPQSAREAIKFGRALASRRGWTGNQWSALLELWSRESGWEPGRLNPSSFAAGIPQALPGSKIYGAAFNSMRRVTRDGKLYLANADGEREIRWGLDYIAGRYGTPAAALNFHDANNWYAKGGIVSRPTVFGAGESGSEAILPLDTNLGTRVLSRAMSRADRDLEGAVMRLVDTLSRDGGDRPISVSIDGYEIARAMDRRKLLRGGADR